MANGLEMFQGKKNPPAPGAPRVNVVSALMLFIPAGLGIAATVAMRNPVGAFAGLLLGLLLAQSPRVAKQWEKAVVLRLGKYVGLRGPGLFWSCRSSTPCRPTSISASSRPASRRSRP
jgi:hypothetical protein